MAASNYRPNFHKLKVLDFQDYPRKIIYCSQKKYNNRKNKSIPQPLSYSKVKKIDKLISNIYLYKFPPILNWTEGRIYIDIPVDFTVIIRKIFEHSSEIILDNIKEICFTMNVDASSYGNKIIIMPIEYIINKHEKVAFIDTLSHETGHSLSHKLFKYKNMHVQIRAWHKIIEYYSINFHNNLFFIPDTSDKTLAKYQLKSYKEFFSELFSHILNYYDELIDYICQIPFEEVQDAYLNVIDLMKKYVVPFSSQERQELIISTLD